MKAASRARATEPRATRKKAETAATHPHPPARGRVELVRGVEDTRIFIHLLASFIHRVDHDRRQIYFDDLEMAYVAGTVGLEATDASLRLPEFREKYRDLHNIIGVAGQRGVNALSVAQATGIPRETVRRKLKQLVERGALAEKSPGNYVVKPGFLQKSQNVAVFESAMRYTLHFINECLAHGLIRWTTDPGEATRDK